MFKNIVLQKPLAIIDLETTGRDVKTDRIVEISVLKILPAGQQDHRTRRLNPGKPIPAEATAVHGITDADVNGEPRFKRVNLRSFLDGCDLCGFNLKRFDLPILNAEFWRTDRRELVLEGRAIIDPMEIYHRREPWRQEPRNLRAAVRFYCGREHDNAHTARADVLATAEVLDAQLVCYPDLPRSIAELHQQFTIPNAVDSSGRFVRIEGQVRFNFGLHRSKPLDAVVRERPDYLEWMLTDDFPDDTKAVVRQALHDAAEHKADKPYSPPIVSIFQPKAREAS